MAVSNVLPASGSTLNYAESFSFEVTAGYTSLLVRVTTSGGVLESAYDTGTGGVGAGYTVVVEDLGATHKVTVTRDAGWSIDPMTVYVTEDATTTTDWTYDIFPTQEYPEGMQPYNDVSAGEAGAGVITFEGRSGNVVATLNDYDASLVNNDSSVVGATVKDALETLDAYVAPVTSVFGRTGAVVAVDGDYGSDAITNESGVAGATVSGALDALETDLNTKKPKEISGAGAPGVSTGNGYDLGTIYVDTTGDQAYTLVDATTDANVWSAGVTDHGALDGLDDDDHVRYVDKNGTRAQDALYLAERADHVNIPGAGFGEFWAKNTSPWNKPYYTDNAGNDWLLLHASAFNDKSIPYMNGANGGITANDTTFTYNYTIDRLIMGGTPDIALKERATPGAATATWGYLWVKNDAPNRLKYLDDASGDHTIAYLSEVTDGQTARDALYLTERADHVNTPATGYGELWLENNADQELRFTDEAGTDYTILRLPDSENWTNTSLLQGTSNRGDTRTVENLRYSGSQLQMYDANANIRMKEGTTPGGLSTYGHLWVKNDTPNRAMFTNDTGEDAAVIQRPGLRYEYDSTTTANPASGEIRWNNATQTLATKIYLAYTDKDGLYNAYALQQLEPFCSAWVTKESDPTQRYFAYFSAVNDASIGEGPSYVELDIQTDTNSTNWANMSDGEIVYIEFLAPGRYRESLGFKETTTLNAATDGFSDAFLWVKDDTQQQLKFTDDQNDISTVMLWDQTGSGAGTTPSATGVIPVWNSQGSKSRWTQPPDTFAMQNNELKHLGTDPVYTQAERAAAPGLTAGRGKWWVHNDAPNRPCFTDDVGNDYYLDRKQIRLSCRPDVGGTQNYWYTWNTAGPYYDYIWSHAASGGTSWNLSNCWTNCTTLYFPDPIKILSVECSYVQKGTVDLNLDWWVGYCAVSNGQTAANALTTVASWLPGNFGTVANKRFLSGPWSLYTTDIPAESQLWFTHKRTTATAETVDPYVDIIINYVERVV